MTSASQKAMDKPRRFYREVAVQAAPGGYGVALDERLAKTPAGAVLALPTRALADLVAQEWAAQDEVVDLSRMLATRLAFTAIDGGAPSRAAQVEEVRGYAGSDLLCYFAEAPPSLAAEEAARWGPVLEWAEAALGLHFVRVTGVMHRPQPSGTPDRAAALAQAADDFTLTCLAFAVGLYGSTVLAFAVQRQHLGGDEAFDLSRLDEAHQERLWGVDAEAAQRTAGLRAEAAVLDRWFAAVASERKGLV